MQLRISSVTVEFSANFIAAQALSAQFPIAELEFFMPVAKARKAAKTKTTRAKVTRARKSSAPAPKARKALLARKPQKSTRRVEQKPARKPTMARAPESSPPAMRPVDAIDLLKSDHREAETLFAQFEKASTSDRKASIVAKICEALTAHVTIEEEIFYGAAREALKKKGEDLVDEAEEEHEGIKFKIKELKNAGPGDVRYDAKVNVLKEYVQHHVKEEERELFPKLRRSDFDAEAVGEKLAARKEQLTGIPVKREPVTGWGFRSLLG